MRHQRLLLIALWLVGVAPAFAQQTRWTIDGVGTAGAPSGGVVSVQGVSNGTAVVVSFSTVDPCQSSNVAKASVALDATADAQLVALSGSTVIYVCGWTATVGGTAPTYRFQTGTGSVCGTGTVNETGTMAPSAATPLASHGGDATIFAGAAGAALCIDVGGTTPSVQGVLTYVQQ